jgi:hypothetical protein
MINATKIRSVVFSRRSILRNFALATAGGAAILSTIVTGVRVAAAQTKVSQKSVGYQDTPKGTQQCDNCTNFVAPASCNVVEGNIAPAGWCTMYVKKPA